MLQMFQRCYFMVCQCVTSNFPERAFAKRGVGQSHRLERGQAIKIIRWNKHENKWLRVNQAELRPVLCLRALLHKPVLLFYLFKMSD